MFSHFLFVQMSSSSKRKRSSAATALMVYRPYKKPYTKRRRTGAGAFQPGVDRTGGYYGRYSGRSSELKFHDVDLDADNVAATGVIEDSINKIAQGVTENTRVGRKCTIKSINWHYWITLNERDAVGTPPNPDVFRIILFLDKQCNGATAAILDILETAHFQSFRNLANSGRFQILMDKTIPMNYNGIASDNNGVVSSSEVFKTGSFYKSCNIPLEFSGTTGAIGEIRSNNIGVIFIAEANNCDFDSSFRLRFSDSG